MAYCHDNYVLKADGDHTLNNIKESVIYDDGTNVGIGTDTPAKKLHIKSSGGDDGIQISNSSDTILVSIKETGTDAAYLTLADGGVGKIQLNSNAGSDSYINNGGRVGIGTNSPSHALSIVEGDYKMNLGNVLGETGISLHADNVNYERADIRRYAGFLSLLASVDSSSPGSTDGIIIENGGNVGIGTASPGAKLEIKGEDDGEALTVTDANGKEMLVVKDNNTTNEKSSIWRGIDSNGHLWVIPKAKTDEAIQECINYLMGLNNTNGERGGTVYLPAGVYTLDNQITIGEGQQATSAKKLIGHGIKIVGAGPRATILEIDNASAQNGILIQGGQGDSTGTSQGTKAHAARNVHLKDFKIRPSDTGTANHTGIYNAYGAVLLVENVTIEGMESSGTEHRFQYGIRSECWCATFFKCSISYIANGGYAIYLGTNGITSEGGTATTEANCNNILECNINMLSTGTDANIGTGIYLVGDSGNSRYVSGCIISGIAIGNSDKRSIPYCGYGIHVSNDYVYNTTITGCYLELLLTGININSANGVSILNQHFTNQLGTRINMNTHAQSTDGVVITESEGGNMEVVGSAVNTGHRDNLIINQDSDADEHYSSLAFAQTSTNTGARITSGNPGSYHGYLSFETRNGDSAGKTTIPRVRIDEDGNVGIGTTDPDEMLDVNGLILSSYAGQGFKSYGSSSNVAARFFMHGIYDYLAVRSYNSEAGKKEIRFQQQDSVGFSESMIIDTGGNVGIGTDTPSRTLEVNGVIGAGDDTDGICMYLNGAVGTILGRDMDNTDYNALEFRTGASPCGIYINTVGRVGIGTNSPSHALSIVEGDYKINLGNVLGETGISLHADNVNYERADIRRYAGFLSLLASVDSSSPGSTDGIIIENGGNVGIGTASPGAKLDVNAASGHAGKFTIANQWAGLHLQDDSSNILWYVYPNDADLGGTIMELRDAGSTKILLDTDGDSYFNGGNVGIWTDTPNAPLDVNGLILSSYAGQGFKSYGSSSNVAARFFMHGTSNYLAVRSYNSEAGKKEIRLQQQDSVDVSERMIIDTGGNVGIGTTSPGEKLHVYDGNVKIEKNFEGETNLKIRNTNAAGSGGSAVLEFDFGSAYNTRLTQSNSLFEIGYNIKLQLRRRGLDTPALYIDSDNYNPGNVGIGTTTVPEKLTVNGNIKNSGNIEIDGDLNHDGSNIGFFNTTPTGKQTVTGSKGGNAALASLITALANYGLITDSTS